MGVTVVCDARLLDDPFLSAVSSRFDVELIGCMQPEQDIMQKAQGKVRLFSSNDIPQIASGDIVRFQARLKTPRDFQNPGSFSWRRYLLTRGIGAVGSVRGPEWLLVLSRSHSGSRRRLDQSIANLDDDRAGGILRAMVTGRREAVGNDVRNAFQLAGIAHLLAVSGLHVGYVALFIYLLVRLLVGPWTRLTLRIPLQKIAATITLPCVWFFVFLVGSPVSAVRAGIMISVYLVGLILGLRQDLLVTLAVAALLIVVIEPLAVFDISFQLSFISVLAIILITPRLMGMMRSWFEYRRGWHWRMLHRMFQLAAVTVAATLGASPMVAYHFHMVTVAGFLANLVAVPWTGLVILPLAALASAMTFLWPYSSDIFFWPLAGKAAGSLLAFADGLSTLADPLVMRIAPNGVELMLAYAVIVTLVFWRQLPYRRLVAVGLTAGLIFNVGWWQMKPLMTDRLEVTFLDVGQGDAALIRFPGGKSMLIDGGGLPRGEFDIGEHVVAPVLLAKGIHRVDWLMLSHPHHDHYRGLAAVAERFHPDVLWTNGFSPPEKELEFWNDFMRRVEGSGVSIRRIDASFDPIEVNGVKLEVLHPRGKVPHDLDLNESSLVLKFTYDDVSFLFTGDLMDWGENELMNSGSDIGSTVLKVAHHGSDTSSSTGFIESVRPKYAIISAGQYNPYGMPAPIVLDRLNESGTTIYRTDKHGAVTVITDGSKIDVITEVSPTRRSSSERAARR